MLTGEGCERCEGLKMAFSFARMRENHLSAGALGSLTPIFRFDCSERRGKLSSQRGSMYLPSGQSLIGSDLAVSDFDT